MAHIKKILNLLSFAPLKEFLHDDRDYFAVYRDDEIHLSELENIIFDIGFCSI